MSHFNVLVIGDDVEGQLAPYHEFECTGKDDQYVQTVDETEEARKDFEGGTTRRLRDPEGNLYDPYAERFYREPTTEELKKIGPIAGSGGNATLSWTSKDWKDGQGYRTKVHQIPDGWEDVEVPRAQVESFAEWAAGWYGRELLDEGTEPDLAGAHKYGWITVRRQAATAEAGPVEVIGIFDRTNPNKQWDWWVIGGRWSNFLRLKPEVAAMREQLVREDKLDPFAVGERSFLIRDEGAGPDYLHANQAKKGDVDFQAMRDEAAEEAREEWRKAHAVIAGREVPIWKDMLGEEPTREHVEAMRKAYQENPVVRDLYKAKFYDGLERLACTEDEYAARAAEGAVRTFAVVRDSIWHERGSMGWFGMVSDEKDEGEWNRQFNELLDGLPDDALLTVVDCHI